ncbi:MAG: YdbH domain-containing protein [Opitutaceae bacterium]
MALWLGALGETSTAAETWKLPSVQGTMEGDFSAGLLPGAPGFHWSLRSTKPRMDEQVFVLSIEGAALRARADAVRDLKGDGSWRLIEAEADLAAWWPGLAMSYVPAHAGLEVTGAARLAGEGVLRGGQPSGQIELQVDVAMARDPKQGWSVAGVALRGRLGELPALTTTEPFLLQFREAALAGVALRDGVVKLALPGDGTLRVTSATCAMLDGRVALTPFTVDLAKNKVRTTVDFTDVELSGLAKFLPPALAEARGRVSGQLEVVWDLQRGLTVASGGLRPGASGFAAITLAPAPGFLTDRLPANMRERIQLLPEWMGPVRKLFAPANPAYPILRAIEMGESSLDLTALEVGVSLDGDARGRSAHIVATTRPTTPGTAVGSVRFEFNVTGPLADFARLLAEGRLNLHVR